MPQPEPHVSSLGLAVHGGTGFAGIGNGERLLDFSTCCNPYPPPPSVRRAVASCDLSHYPDPESRQFIAALSHKLGIATENIMAGSGSTELIRLASLAYLGPGRTAAIPIPTYSEYARACRLINTPVFFHKIKESHGFRLEIEDFISRTQPQEPAAVFLCNPNNPTGQYLSRPEVEAIIAAFPSALIVLDEAYIAFTSGAWSSQDLIKHDNLLIIRSLTKDYALAGLRLGYCLASRPVINTLKKVRPPWNVGTPAQQAGLAALAADDYLETSRRRIEGCKLYLMRALAGLGYKVPDTSTNFFLVKTGDAAGFRQRLLEKGMLVRDCTSFGLPEYIRIAPRSMADCRRLVQVIRETKRNNV